MWRLERRKRMQRRLGQCKGQALFYGYWGKQWWGNENNPTYDDLFLAFGEVHEEMKNILKENNSLENENMALQNENKKA